TQTPLGFEKTLSEQIWLRVIAEVQQNLPADTGLLAFVDAIAAYVAGEDEKCVLNLCLCVEILGNKHRILSGSRDVDFIKIIKQSPLFENDVQRQLASRLFIDRGHIAHGRTPPYLASKDTPLSYVELVRNFVNCYLNSIKPGDWRKATTTVLGKTPKK
ncbi:MAG: hypothetical protein Q8L65_03935, partial [Burkholderiales bacterium]|nr:hypothetical protein [Burkholderiales bacterium]